MPDDEVAKAAPTLSPAAGVSQQPVPGDPNAGNPYTGGGTGQFPTFNDGLTFREVGSSGLRYFAGWPYEEFLPQLQGRYGAQQFREMMDNSATIGGIMFSIQSTLRQVEWRCLPADDSPDAQVGADFINSCREDMAHTWEDLIAENLSMLGYGFAPHEIVYKRRLGRDPGPDPMRPGHDLPKSEYDDGLIGWRKMPLRGQDTILKWFLDENGAIKGLTQQPWIGVLVDIPIDKMLLFRPTQHKNNPQGRSILRTAFRAYYMTKRMEEQEAILAERMGGVPVVKIPQALFLQAQNGDGNARIALESYKKMAVNVRIDEQMGIVLPSDVFPTATGSGSAPMYSFELATPQGGRGSALNFQESITRYSINMLTSVLADFLQLGHEARGTQSLAVSKVDMFFLAIEGYLNSMAAIYNRYAIPRLWALNGMDFDLMPKLEPDLAQRLDLDVLSNYVLRLSQSGMPLFPNEELQSYLSDAAGLPDVTDDRALLAAGMADQQLDREEEKSDVALDQMKNPPEPPAGSPKSNLNKMLAASLAKRIIRLQGPRFGVTSKRAKPKSTRKARIAAYSLARGE